jgi:RNA polymerase sigma-70 factor (ECF subfamily)
MNLTQPLPADPPDDTNDDAGIRLDEQHGPDQFQSVYRQWLSPVYRYAYFFLGNGADAEDLTSQVFLSVYQALPRYHCNGHFAGWLFTIAHNQALEYIRKRAREVSFEAARDIPAGVDIPQEVISRQEIQQLRDLILKLPHEEQELIRLRYVAGLSFADMGMVLKRGEDSVKKSLYRLQARLQSLLEDYHE